MHIQVHCFLKTFMCKIQKRWIHVGARVINQQVNIRHQIINSDFQVVDIRFGRLSQILNNEFSLNSL